ncbi:MAG: YfhO family protein [Blastocatellia bacterium]
MSIITNLYRRLTSRGVSAKSTLKAKHAPAEAAAGWSAYSTLLMHAPALLAIVAVFILFFWPATLKGQLLVFSDSLIYSYPLRVVAFDALRHGSLPLWTPTLLSGYPLLSMAQLGLGYPLTWFYLFLPGYWAEQIYILAPYLLGPMFTYAYLRQVSVSRVAALLAGLSFTYGGMMAGGMAHNGMVTNAVMWLPLMLVAIERAQDGQFERCLLGVAGAYSMSVLTGIGQGFLYTGLIALAYAIFVTFAVSPGIWRRHWYGTGSDSDRVDLNGQHRKYPVATAPGSVMSSGDKSALRLKAGLRMLRPLTVCVVGMTLAAGVGAFQILETLPAQRRSIRSELTYEIFSGGGFTPWQTFIAFFAPYHNLNWEATPYVAVLTGVLALAAVVAALRSPLTHRRVLFWLGLALLGWILMMGDHTPLYKLAFHIPVVNRFRLPWRHTFEWSFAVSVLGAFGFDVLRNFFTRRQKEGVRQREALTGLILFAGMIAAGIGWWRASELRMAAGEALLKSGESTQFVTMSQSAWIGWELGFTLLALLTLGCCWRMKASRLRDGLLVATVSAACCLEGFMLVSVWWFPYAKPAKYFQAVSAPTQFLKQYSPEQNRIYTSLADYSSLNVALAEPHNLSALHGFHNAAGYEPLMPDKYRQAFDGRWSFFTPWFGALGDPQMLSPRWQVLDILNTRFLLEFSASATKTIEKDGVAFAARDIAMTLEPKASVTLTGAAVAVDSLSLVSALANSSELAQGVAFARVAIQTTDGRTIERELKAGVDSAEWAHERADVKLLIKHRLAPVFDSVPGDNQNSFSANRYWSRIELGDKATVDHVEIANIAEHASLILTKVALYDSSKRQPQQALPLAQRLPDHWRKQYDHEGVQIYENQRALPRVWLTTQAEAVTSEESLRRIRGQSEIAFNPKITALLETTPETLRGLSGGELGAEEKAQIIRYESNNLVIETNATQQTVLVVSEMNYPGWEAKVDGQHANIWTTDYLLRGVILPAGKHRVEMRYTAPAARNGAILSALSLLVLIGLILKARRH